MINCVSGNPDMELCLEYNIYTTICVCCMFGVSLNLLKCQKPVALCY